jgi:hypothetical protein
MFLLEEYDTGPSLFLPSFLQHYTPILTVRQAFSVHNAHTGATTLQQAMKMQREVNFSYSRS